MMGHIFLDRSDRQVAISQSKEAAKNLQTGTSILFFPEGTRSDDSNLKDFKIGAFRMAKDLEFPILPVVVKNTANIMPTSGIDLRPGRPAMVILEPITLASVKACGSEQLLAMSRAAIARELDQQRN
jgi:1-acyl-sn-glycerol-3-phosphate acyltransferase